MVGGPPVVVQKMENMSGLRLLIDREVSLVMLRSPIMYSKDFHTVHTYTFIFGIN